MPRTSKYSVAASPQKTPIKYSFCFCFCRVPLTKCRVPLNDDRQEKASRRHALHEAQRNSLRASATPNRRRVSLAVGQDSPHTPSQDPDGMPEVAGTAVTPMKRVMPLLANFEEWMKMATDNVCGRPGFKGSRLTSAENQRKQFLEFCPNRLLPRNVTVEGRRWCKLPES